MRTNNIWVVETDEDVFVGQLDIDLIDSHTIRCVTVYSGFQGRPPVIPAQDIESMVLAKQHPDVLTIARGRRT